MENTKPSLFSMRGEVDIIHCNEVGKILARYERQKNTITRVGEDFLTTFFKYLNSDKYDANEGGAQAGYMDCMSVGVGILSDGSTGGTSAIIVLAYAPAGFSGDNQWLDGKTVKIYTGSNAGETQTVKTDGYVHSNGGYGGNPTIEVASPFSNTCATGIQLSITPSDRETALQGEATADGDGVTMTSATNHRKVVTSKTVQSNTNELIISAQWASTPLSGGSSIRLVEAGLHNHATNGSGATPSGDMFSRVTFPQINKAAADTVTLNWKFILGTAR